MDLLLEIVNLYFDYVHDQFHSLFHRPTFVQDVTQHAVPKPLLFGILGLGARFSTNPALADLEPRDKGRKYMREAERHLNLRDISLETVQLCVLLGAGSTGDGETEGENLFYSVSCRTAQLLGLPHRQAVSPLQKEIDNRGMFCLYSCYYSLPLSLSLSLSQLDEFKKTNTSTVWWSLCMIDVWSSAAVKLPRLLPFDGDGAPLPMDDLPFLHLQRPPTSSITSPTSLPPSGAPSPEQPIFERRSPIIAQMVQLNRILLEVNDFNKQCATHTLTPVDVENGIQTLVHRMDGWLSEAPRDVRDTPDNFHWFHVRGLGRAYAAIYLGYYHFGQLLYYQFLHVGNGVPAGSPARVYSDRCKHHSAQLCDMIYRAFFTPGSDVRYHMVAHVLVIASTVQIHTLLFSDDETQIADARARLEKNFEILLLLRPYWPALDRIMGRLRAFHETCRVNMSSSFVLDRWMLQFLVAFGGIMDEKPAMAADDDPASFYRLDGIL